MLPSSTPAALVLRQTGREGASHGTAPSHRAPGGQSSGDRLAGLQVKQMSVVEIERDRELGALRSAGGAVEGGDEAVRARPQVDHRLRAHRLNDLDRRGHGVAGLRCHRAG